MSDLHEVREKVEEGAEWRGTIRVQIDDEEMELTVRQLRDPEFFEVMSMIDREELQELREQLPSEKMSEYQELQQADELDADERERFDELESELEENSEGLFTMLSYETFEGVRKCAKYAVEPDDDDVEHAFRTRASAIEREYGIKVSQPEDIIPALQDDIDDMIDRATKFTSFNIGIQALVQSVGEDEGN